MNGEARWIATEVGDTGLPPPSEVAAVELPDGALITLRRHGRPGGPRVIMSHGNGLAMDAYFPFWRLFLDDFDLILFDLRNHGWNPVGDLWRHHIPAVVWDLEHLWSHIGDRFGARPAVGVFHSLSALGALHHALRAGPRFHGLVLFEPPVPPPPGHELEPVFWGRREQIRRVTEFRQVQFESYAAFADTLRRAGSMRRLVPEAFALYARATLRPCAEGGYRLRCPSEFEGKIYAENCDSTLALEIASVPRPLLVLGGDPDAVDAMPPTRICNALFPEWGIDFATIPGTSHFAQLEAPDACFDRVRAFLDTCSG